MATPRPIPATAFSTQPLPLLVTVLSRQKDVQVPQDSAQDSSAAGTQGFTGRSGWYRSGSEWTRSSPSPPVPGELSEVSVGGVGSVLESRAGCWGWQPQ